MNEDKLKEIFWIRNLDHILPLSFRSDLLSKKNLSEEHSKNIDNITSIVFSSGETFLRNDLYNAISEAYEDSNNELTLNDTDGNEWLIKKSNLSKYGIDLSSNVNSFTIDDHWMLIPCVKKREVAYSDICDIYNFPEKKKQFWKTYVTSDKFEYSKVITLKQDISNTPIAQINKFIDEIKYNRKVDNHTFCPRDLIYFERLAGELPKNLRRDEYFQTQLNSHISELIRWDKIEGLKLAFLLSSSSFVTNQIDISSVPKNKIKQVFEFISDRGDMISKIGAIEVGLKNFDECKNIRPIIAKLINEIMSDNPQETDSNFQLTSSLAICVDSLILEIIKDNPPAPFWRRLASIAHASLLERCIINLKPKHNYHEMVEDLYTNFKHLFHLKNLCDQREEPRWKPDFIYPDQLKQEFLARIYFAGLNAGDKIKGTKVHRLIFGEKQKSVSHDIHPINSLLPGPLDGSITPKLKPPEYVKELIENPLKETEIATQSFAALINTCLVFDIDENVIERAMAKLHNHGNYAKEGEYEGSTTYLAEGLATIASNFRKPEIAQQVRKLISNYPKKNNNHINIQQVFFIGITAAASYQNLKDWCKFLKDWIEELSFSELDEHEAEFIHSSIIILCDLIPELSRYLGRSEAALNAYLNS